MVILVGENGVSVQARVRERTLKDLKISSRRKEDGKREKKYVWDGLVENFDGLSYKRYEDDNTVHYVLQYYLFNVSMKISIVFNKTGISDVCIVQCLMKSTNEKFYSDHTKVLLPISKDKMYYTVSTTIDGKMTTIKGVRFDISNVKTLLSNCYAITKYF